jgi:preprotein translocase subunit SecF
MLSFYIMNEQEFIKEIQLIKARNERVEIDKAWEVSWTRRFIITVITYIVASVWLWVISEPNIFPKAVVPTAGYLLSTISIPHIKKLWVDSQKKTSDHLH